MKKRNIVYIPTIHHCLEKRDILENTLSKKTVDQYFRDTNKFWKEIDDYIKKINVKIDKIFWEGWRGNEKEISTDRKNLGKITDKLTDDDLLQKMLESTAKMDKISNIVLDLIKKGAVLEETESNELINEHKKIRDDLINFPKNLDKNNNIAIEHSKKLNENNFVLIQKRDRYIAKQINYNLLTGETGILFIGRAHNVLSYLSDDIEIITDSNISDMGEKIINKYFKYKST